jgi:hypothetical protein
VAWRVYAAAVAGSSHVAAGLPCQDAFSYRVVGDVLVAVVCDGAGSAVSSHLGARATSSGVVGALAQRLTAAAATGREFLRDSPEAARTWLHDVVAESRAELCAQAAAAEAPLGDYAATLVGVVAGPAGGWFFHIGDGVGVAGLADGSSLVSLPENGEYANETYFVTGDEWARHLRLLRLEAPLQRLALMSDGAAPFAMNKGCQALFEPFIVPVEKFLLATDERTGSAALARTLGDPRTHRITADDKTLLLAYA